MMLAFLCKTTSLRNLQSNSRGQIATILILMMVAALILILVTVNLGRTSLTTLQLSNAADSGSLFLASQLASKSRFLWENNEQTIKQEISIGILDKVLAIVIAVVAVVLVPFTAGASVGFFAYAAAHFWTMVAVGALGGALGGGIGASILGTNVLDGAWQGAKIGACIGAGVSAAGGPLAAGDTVGSSGAVAGAEGNIVTLEGVTPTFIEAGNVIPAGAVIETGSAVALSPAWTVAIEALSATTNLWSATVSQKRSSAFYDSLAKMLNGLPESERFRESVFLQVLSQTVDDPTMVPDVNDLNGDGDTEEKIPYFDLWWEGRVKCIKDKIGDLNELVNAFRNGPLADFESFINAQYSSGGPLCRAETDGADGNIVELARALENAGYDISFWEPGTPDPNSEKYYDEIDRVSSEFKGIAAVSQAIRGKSLGDLSSTWKSWVVFFYSLGATDSGSDEINGDYYTLLGSLNLAAWESEIAAKRISLAQCQDQGGTIVNPPCAIEEGLWGALAPYAGTIDQEPDDEFTPAIEAIEGIIAKAEGFREAIRIFYDNMKLATSVSPTGYGGENPVTYSWKDSLGEHSIIVEIDPRNIGDTLPELVTSTKNKGNILIKKKVVTLKNYNGKVGVRITRQDPANTDMGILGKWNPFEGKITRSSKAYYSYDNVYLLQ